VDKLRDHFDLCNNSPDPPNTHDEARLIAGGYGVPAGKVTVIPNGVDERFADTDPSLFKDL
jgi:hypothetical protein